ncbi:MAG: hydrolase 1, exosortase A system-associated [Pseudomonadota bacterium]
MGEERPLFFDCLGESLFGVLHDSGQEHPKRGLVIIVGGPQYRVGSHRQFVLLARAVAAGGFPALRFDYRGMGDSDGPSIDFEDCGPDISAAINALCGAYPSLESVTLWGLCDAASASLFYAASGTDPRVDGLVLLNPWVRTVAGEARAQATGYYGRRLASRKAWLDLLRRPKRVLGVLGNLMGVARRMLSIGNSHEASLPERVMTAFEAYRGDALLVISGDDLTATEFLTVARDDSGFVQALEGGRFCRFDVADADHTFSTAAWRDQVERETLRWLQR